jgi:hypothetical protein
LGSIIVLPAMGTSESIALCLSITLLVFSVILVRALLFFCELCSRKGKKGLLTFWEIFFLQPKHILSATKCIFFATNIMPTTLFPFFFSILLQKKYVFVAEKISPLTFLVVWSNQSAASARASSSRAAAGRQTNRDSERHCPMDVTGVEETAR